MQDRLNHIIYKLTFPNEKIYIDQTLIFKRSMKQYKNINESSIGKFIKNAIKKCGWYNIKKEIIYKSAKEALEKLKINSGSICSVLKGRSKYAGGYIFKYLIGNDNV